MDNTQLSISTNTDQLSTIKMASRFSVIEAVAFKNVFQSICESGYCPSTIILDFSQTLFIDSSGIGALANSIKVSHQYRIRIFISNISQQVLAVLNMTGLTEILQITNQNETQIEKYAEQLLPITHRSIRSKTKRIIDILGSIVGLGICLIILIPISIAIKFDNPGPLFFKQKRCGWMGKHFNLWKFRSMVANAESLKHKVKNQASGAIFKNANDFRITRVGAFLRRTSLDEFPQFWNVLKGDMSLVGTRPPTIDEVEKYEVPQWRRLDVKPGITGEWQVNGRSGVKDFRDIINMDLKYQKNWSLFYDFKLILKTVNVIFGKNSGAM